MARAASARSASDRRNPSEAGNRRLANRERVNSRGDATRLLILVTAEQLFAERGIAAVPLRDIGIAAGQKNNVAVQYHFGDRDRLLREITAYRGAASEERRVEMLADLLAEGQQPQVSDLVRAFIFPLAGHLEEQNHYLAFLSRYIIEHGGYAGLDNAVPPGTHNTLRSLLGRLLPDYPEEVREERWLVMQTSTVHTLARYQAAMMSGRLTSPIYPLLEDLVRFLTAGIEAPLGPTDGDRDDLAAVKL
jgi:AcrR family transcriptional regulator